MKQKQIKQWMFYGLGLVASLLVIFSLGFRILPLFFLLIAAAIYIVVVILGINLLRDRHFGDQQVDPH